MRKHVLLILKPNTFAKTGSGQHRKYSRNKKTSLRCLSAGVSVATDEEHTKVAGIVAEAIVEIFEPLGPTGILAAVCVSRFRTLFCLSGRLAGWLCHVAALSVYICLCRVRQHSKPRGNSQIQPRPFLIRVASRVRVRCVCCVVLHAGV